MSLFSATTISRYALEGEQDFGIDNPCVVTRLALSIVSGTSLYNIPDTVLRIRRITYKGFKLDPLPHRMMREAFQSANQQGKPFWYIYNNVGQNVIKLFPCPNETITAVQTNLYGSSISTQVIVDYYRIPNGTTAILPTYIRRRLVKAYVLRGCFSLEGAGQNLKNSKYFMAKYENLKQLYGQTLEDLHSKPRKLQLGGGSSSNFPGSPLLPIDRFGTSVDTGY